MTEITVQKLEILRDELVSDPSESSRICLLLVETELKRRTRSGRKKLSEHSRTEQNRLAQRRCRNSKERRAIHERRNEGYKRFR